MLEVQSLYHVEYHLKGYLHQVVVYAKTLGEAEQKVLSGFKGSNIHSVKFAGAVCV